MENKFLTRSEFSKIMKMSESTLYRMIKNDVWPFNAYIKIGNHIRYPAALITEIEKEKISAVMGKSEIENKMKIEIENEMKNRKEMIMEIENEMKTEIKKKMENEKEMIREIVRKIDDKKISQTTAILIPYLKEIIKDAPSCGYCGIRIVFKDGQVVGIEKNKITTIQSELQNLQNMN